MPNSIGLVLFAVIGLGFGFGASQLWFEAEPVERASRSDLETPSRSAQPSPPSPSPTNADTSDRIDTPSASNLGPLLGTIQGIVFDPEGSPVAGIQVFARPTFQTREKLSASEALSRTAEELELIRALARKTQTDSSGRFTLERIGNGSYRVEARSFGWCVLPKSTSKRLATMTHVGVTAEANGQDLEFTAHPATTVQLNVIDPNGEPPDFAEVSLELETPDDYDRTTFQWTPERAEIHISRGVDVLIETRSKYLTSEPVRLSTTDGENREVLIQLVSGSGLRGQVFRFDGRPSAQCAVLVGPARGNEPTYAEAFAELERHWARQSQFEIPLAPGEYWLATTSLGPAAFHVERIRVDGWVDIDVTLPRPDPEKSVRVYGLGPNGSPATDLSIGLIGASALTGPAGDGSFFVDLTESVGNGRTEPISLRVRSLRFGTQIVEVPVPLPERVDVQFDATGVVDVVLAGVVPTWFRQLRARVVDASGAASGWRSPSHDTWLLGPLATGEGRLEIELESSRTIRQNLRIHSQPVNVAQGIQTVEVELPPLPSLTIQFPAEYSGRNARLSNANLDSIASVRIPSSGTVTIAPLPPAKYSISVEAVSDTMAVELTDSQTVTFAPRTKNALELIISDPNHPVAKQGFQSGDLIVAIDGKYFESSAELRQAIVAVIRRNRVPVVVQRGRSELELELNVRSLIDQPEGAQIMPSSR